MLRAVRAHGVRIHGAGLTIWVLRTGSMRSVACMSVPVKGLGHVARNRARRRIRAALDVTLPRGLAVFIAVTAGQRPTYAGAVAACEAAFTDRL